MNLKTRNKKDNNTNIENVYICLIEPNMLKDECKKVILEKLYKRIAKNNEKKNSNNKNIKRESSKNKKNKIEKNNSEKTLDKIKSKNEIDSQNLNGNLNDKKYKRSSSRRNIKSKE